MTTSSSQVPILHQPIYIQPEEKKDKPVPGGGLYTDIYNSYRASEMTYLAWVDPYACAIGAIYGTGHGLASWWLYGAPKKIAQDGEITDFGSTVHTKGLTSVFSILGKKFCLDVLPMAHFESVTGWLGNEEITTLSYGVKYGFIAMKAAKVTNEIVQRIANWVDIPAK